MKQHDDSWISYIGGAPDLVNERFFERYAPHLLATPTPTPSPTPEVRGFSISGQGPGTHEIEASGELVCSAEVTGNRMRSGRGDQFNVSAHGTGYQPAGDGVLGLKRGPVRRWIGGVEGAAVALRPKVIYFGSVDDLEQSFLGPYTVGVYAARAGKWTVQCDPVEPLPAARGFAVSGETKSSPVVWGEDVIAIGGEPAGLLDCDAIWNPPHRSYRTYGPGFQWTLWGHDENGERVSYGYEQRSQRVLRESDRVWLGQKRPGEYAAFLPPYSFQVFAAGAWRIRCEPVP